MRENPLLEFDYVEYDYVEYVFNDLINIDEVIIKIDETGNIINNNVNYKNLSNYQKYIIFLKSTILESTKINKLAEYKELIICDLKKIMNEIYNIDDFIIYMINLIQSDEINYFKEYINIINFENAKIVNFENAEIVEIVDFGNIIITQLQCLQSKINSVQITEQIINPFDMIIDILQNNNINILYLKLIGISAIVDKEIKLIHLESDRIHLYNNTINLYELYTMPHITFIQIDFSTFIYVFCKIYNTTASICNYRTILNNLIYEIFLNLSGDILNQQLELLNFILKEYPPYKNELDEYIKSCYNVDNIFVDAEELDHNTIVRNKMYHKHLIIYNILQINITKKNGNDSLYYVYKDINKYLYNNSIHIKLDVKKIIYYLKINDAYENIKIFDSLNITPEQLFIAYFQIYDINKFNNVIKCINMKCIDIDIYSLDKIIITNIFNYFNYKINSQDYSTKSYMSETLFINLMKHINNIEEVNELMSKMSNKI